MGRSLTPPRRRAAVRWGSVLVLAAAAVLACCGAAPDQAQARVKAWAAESTSGGAEGARADPEAADSGVWAAPHVQERRLPGDIRVFELSPQHFAVLMPLPADRHAHSLRQLERCDTGWDILAATQKEADEGEFNSFRCVPTTSQAKASLSEFNSEPLTKSVLREVFNVSAPCTNRRTGSALWEMISGKSCARQWLTALHDGMSKDRWHPDGCEFDPRPRGT
jgi:hypothetical protein